MKAKKIDPIFVQRVELELLSALFMYAAPFIGAKIDSKFKQETKPGNLENLVNQPKIGIRDFKELESLLMKSLARNVRTIKKAGINSKGIFYSIILRRQKNKNETGKYSISIKYEENSEHEKLSVKIKKDGKEIYSADSNDKKALKNNIAPYGITISYEDKYGEERLMITYRQQLNKYMKQHMEDKENMANRVPLKWLNILPETMMGGVLGFTYLGENFMGRRADLTGKTARMVDIHESIHTPDEYETRILTSWIMSKERIKYIK